MRKRITKIVYPYLYILPVVTFFGLFMAYPIVNSIAISFFNWVGLSAKPFDEFIGIRNFIDLFKDPYFFYAARNTIWYVIATIILQNLYGYFLALIIFFGKFRFGSVIRAVIFFPTLLAVVIVGLIWRQILSIDGIVNFILNTFGIDNVLFLLDFKIAMWVFIFVHIWQWGGYNMVIFYAGLQSIDPQLVEAAMIDGAGWPSILSRIVTPILKPTIAIAVTLTALGSFKVFDIVWVMTHGKPAHTTEVITTYIHFLTFDPYTTSRFSYAASLVVIFFLIVLIVSFIRLRFITRNK